MNEPSLLKRVSGPSGGVCVLRGDDPETQDPFFNGSLGLALMWRSMNRCHATAGSQYLSGNRREHSPGARKDESASQSLKPTFPHQECGESIYYLTPWD